jgi:hypothetical protein
MDSSVRVVCWSYDHITLNQENMPAILGLKQAGEKLDTSHLLDLRVWVTMMKNLAG